MTRNNKHKITALLFLKYKSPNKTLRYLLLLMWLADRIHLNVWGRMIVCSSYKVYNEGIYSVELNGIDCPQSEYDERYLSEHEIETLNFVLNKYLLSHDELLVMLRKSPEFNRYFKATNNDTFNVIIEDFFEPFPSDVDYDWDEDIIKLSRNDFEINNKIII